MSSETPPGDASDPAESEGRDPIVPVGSSEGGPSESGQPTPCAHTEYRAGEATSHLPATGDGATGVERAVWDALYGIEDPEMPISIVDLGLVYGVRVVDGRCEVAMTLTYTGCPARDLLLETVESSVERVPGVETVDLDLVWNPPWSVEMVTEAGREDLREFGVSI